MRFLSVKDPAGNPKGCVSWVGGSSACLATHLSVTSVSLCPLPALHRTEKQSKRHNRSLWMFKVIGFVRKILLEVVECNYRQVVSFSI